MQSENLPLSAHNSINQKLTTILKRRVSVSRPHKFMFCRDAPSDSLLQRLLEIERAVSWSERVVGVVRRVVRRTSGHEVSRSSPPLGNARHGPLELVYS